MRKSWASKFIGIVGWSLVVGFFWLLSAGGSIAQNPSEKLNMENLSANEIIQKALTDALYYEFDKWFEVFEKAIRRLEDSPISLENRIELMKYNFYFSGLLGELCHTLAFTSKYKIKEIADQFLSRLEEERPTRDENEQTHFCVYFLPFNPETKQVFIGDHRKSGLWLVPGGHIDMEEEGSGI